MHDGSDLVREGWPIYPDTPYYYAQLEAPKLKAELLREAARNAYQRATLVAESSGCRLGALKAPVKERSKG